MNLKDTFETIRHFGPIPVFQGIAHRVIKNVGFVKRKLPAVSWEYISWSDLSSVPFPQAHEHLRSSAQFMFPVPFEPVRNRYAECIHGREKVIHLADQIGQGKLPFFSDTVQDLGWPVKWLRNPFNGALWPKKHWADIHCFVKELDDVKLVWEASRFSWVYPLIRAYALTGDDEYPQAFWQMISSWCQDNPPQIGPNWLSGQECAIRIWACCFALFAFLDHSSSTPQRVQVLLTMLALHGQRIRAFIGEAIRQKTNHSLSEGAGLYTLGAVFPFLREAAAWRKLGKKVLTSQGLAQIHPDGSYVQHSMNYHRLMLQVYLWVFRLAEIYGGVFEEKLRERVFKATEFLYQLQDPAAGRMPNYGPNDGALVLPLNSCDYIDYRPVIQAGWYLFKRERLYPAGPWDEDLLWLFGPEALAVPIAEHPRRSMQFPAGGYFSVRARDSWAMIRCHTYSDRVNHVDMMHLDLWADGVNLLRDGGSYKYYAPDEPAMEGYFKSIEAHNTVIVDNAGPLRLVSRFIWLPWPKASVRKCAVSDERIEWQGVNLAYARSPWSVVHVRTVDLDVAEDRWTILDECLGSGRHEVELRWHLPPGARIISQEADGVMLALAGDWRLRVEGTEKITARILCGQPDGGWESLYYGRKEAISTLCVKCSDGLPISLRTLVWRETFCGNALKG